MFNSDKKIRYKGKKKSRNIVRLLHPNVFISEVVIYILMEGGQETPSIINLLKRLRNIYSFFILNSVTYKDLH